MKDVYPVNDYRDYLEHHGVQGQKWGDRNGPPYPLKPGEHSAAEKKAGWRSSLSDDNSEGNRRHVARDASKYLNKIDKKTAYQKRYLSDEQSKVLELKSKMGAECFVLVSFGFQSYYKFPWSVWANMKELYGHQYITPEEGAPYKLKNSGGYRIEFL